MSSSSYNAKEVSNDPNENSSSSSGVFDGYSDELYPDNQVVSENLFIDDDEDVSLLFTNSKVKGYNSIEESHLKVPKQVDNTFKDTFLTISGDFRDETRKSRTRTRSSVMSLSTDCDEIVEALVEEKKSPSYTIFFSTWSMITGLSVFALPYFASRVGLIFTPVLVIVPILMGYTSMLLKKCIYTFPDHGYSRRIFRSFYDLGENTIKKRGKCIMTFLCALNILPNIYRLIFCASVTVNLFHKYIDMDVRYWMIVWIALSFPPMFIKRMSILSWFGLIGSVFYGAGCLILVTLLCTKANTAVYENIKPHFSYTDILIGYGVTLNSYNHHLGVPTMEASMKKPHQFNTVTNLAFIFSAIFKIFLAYTGAAVYGMSTSGSFLSTITNPIAGALMNASVAIAMFFVYPFYIFVSLEAIEPEIYNNMPYFQKYRRFKIVLSIFCRIFVAVFIYTIAASVPTFEMVTSFVGNIRGTITGIVLPLYFYIVIYKDRMSILSYVMHISLIVIFLIIGVAGIVASISAMIYAQK